MRFTIYSMRGVLVSLPIAFVLIFPQAWSTDGFVFFGLGLALVTLGFGLRLWAQQHLHYRIEAGMQLTTTGPYQLIRNPLYVGNMLIFAGTIVASGQEWLALVTLAWSMIVYSAVVRFEEARLTRRYGASYTAFKAAVPRWFPRAPKGKLEFLNHHLMASIGAEFMWFGLPLLVLTRRVL